ncbi:DNA starvation/stationary phase protection protein [Nonomuraea monospora]|uniref:DNA starvation/stationary phase protection protein n=1 Tax=Nonomuraea monospora TaxID=568818 RepID=A0ABP5PXW3_9ACTN
MSITSPLTDDEKKTTADALQLVLVDLITLGLLAKQAHWNLVGPSFTSLHRQLDELADAAREQADTIAERAVTIGATPDGRVSALSGAKTLPELDGGHLTDAQVIKTFCDILAAVVSSLREAVQATAEPDPISQDVLITATGTLEKQYWMFQAQL